MLKKIKHTKKGYLVSMTKKYKCESVWYIKKIMLYMMIMLNSLSS